MLKTFPPPSSLRDNQLVYLFMMIWMNLANLCRYVYVHQNVETFTIVQILYTIFVRGMLLCFRDIVLSLHQSKYAYGLWVCLPSPWHFVPIYLNQSIAMMINTYPCQLKDSNSSQVNAMSEYACTLRFLPLAAFNVLRRKIIINKFIKINK